MIGPEFFYKLIYGNFFSDLGSGDEKKKKALKMTSQLVIFRVFFFFFLNISRTNSKTNKVNQQSVLNL